uniref:Uncharacterized protein n=1 Tax=Branchiostoma floridae TaxID=7739 RepID=C3Z165_BRAFL|eukprot:XP_002597752.1 hypothetical protein BRAFLDRAFT_77346 [Branchiostoma floridae]
MANSNRTLTDSTCPHHLNKSSIYAWTPKFHMDTNITVNVLISAAQELSKWWTGISTTLTASSPNLRHLLQTESSWIRRHVPFVGIKYGRAGFLLSKKLEHASQSFLREALNPGEKILYRRRVWVQYLRSLWERFETSRAGAMRLEPLRHHLDPYVSAWADDRYHGYQTAPAPPPTFNLPSCSQLNRETLCNTLSGMGVETVDFSHGEEMTDPQLRTAIDSTVAFLTSAREMSSSEMSASEVSDDDSPQESQYEGDEDSESGLGSQDQSGPQDTEEVDGDDQVGGSEGQVGALRADLN